MKLTKLVATPFGELRCHVAAAAEAARDHDTRPPILSHVATISGTRTTSTALLLSHQPTLVAPVHGFVYADRRIIHANGLTLTIGAQLGPYEILSPLGAGGMGEVYKAKDTRLAIDSDRAGPGGRGDRVGDAAISQPRTRAPLAIL